MHLKYVQQKYAGVHELSKCQYPNGPTEHAKNKASLHHSLDTDYYYRSLCHIRTIVSPPYILIQKMDSVHQHAAWPTQKWGHHLRKRRRLHWSRDGFGNAMGLISQIACCKVSQIWLGFKSSLLSQPWSPTPQHLWCWIFAYIPSSLPCCPVAVVDTGKVHIHYPAHKS